MLWDDGLAEWRSESRYSGAVLILCYDDGIVWLFVFLLSFSTGNDECIYPKERN